MFSISFDFLPTALVLFVFISTLFSFIAFSLSLVDYCVEVVWATILATFSTLGYHLILVALAYREQTRRKADAIFLTKSANYKQSSGGPVHRYYSTAGVIGAFALVATWTIAFCINTQVTANGKGTIAEEDANHPWNLKVQVAHSVIAAMESLLVLALAIHCLVGRRRVGPALADGKTTGSSEKIDEKTFIRNLERTTGLTQGRQSVASSRFSIDSIAPLPPARKKFGIHKPSFSSLQGKLPRQLVLSKFNR
ncbi:hypothetical protein AAF712_006229 [Marasmius tenuissimus]|uniref:Uncharacterized protein n=1 Tax=Marasmius tenuissimus TaxID=585030 RepID=A0ABR3A0I3_9AGAR